MSLDSKKSFGRLREILWPIHRSELKKVLSMFFLMFFLCTSYSILRNLKDTVILTAKASGAEAIPFLKVWGMLPAAFIGTWFFAKLCNRVSREKIFYIIITSFLLYFLCFTFILYPYRETLHLDQFGDKLMTILPPGFKGLVSLVRNWTFTSFYIICEMWSSIVLSILFWGFANDVTKLSEAKRSYGIFNIGANSAPIFGGGLAFFLGNHPWITFQSYQADAWHHTLIQLILFITLLGVLSMAIYYWIHRNALEPEQVNAQSKFIEAVGPKKKKLSLRESFKYIYRSKYLICVAFIVLGYNISINITDVLWKEQLKNFFKDPNQMLEHMNLITMGIGTIATLGAVFISVMVSRLGWTFIAILTPAIMAVLAIGFFVFLFCGDLLTTFTMTLFGMTPLAVTVYFGSIQNCLSKASKYSVFDASKELAFLPLDQESRIKGKAAIDGLGSGIGKSGASLIYQGFIIALGSVASSTPYIACLLTVVLVLWMIAVVRVGKEFKLASDLESSAFTLPKQEPSQALQSQ